MWLMYVVAKLGSSRVTCDRLEVCVKAKGQVSSDHKDINPIIDIYNLAHV